MTKSNTKRALMMSCLSMLLCVSMLIGSTFAWFTDSASTGVNKIQSGNLDVMLEMSYDGGQNWADAEGESLEFRDANGNATVLWEPGAEFKLPQLHIKNNGSLALKFKVVVSGLSGDMDFAKVLDVYLSVNGAQKALVGTLAEVMALNAAEIDGLIHGELAANTTSDVYEVSVKMQESAGNEYMNKTLSGLCITVYATQDTVEWDSWSNQYDEESRYSDSVEIQAGVPALLHGPSTTVSIPAGALSEGTVVKLKETSTQAPATVVTIDDTLIVAKDISIVDADGNEISQISGECTVTMNIGAGLNADALAVYHKEEKVDFTYDASSGIATFTASSFSPFTVIYENIGTIDSVEKLIAVRDSINAGDTKEGVVYTLTEDLDLANVEWTTIKNFAGTLDGNGHTISNLNNAALFNTVSGEVKNLNLKGVTAIDKSQFASFAHTVSGKVTSCNVSDVDITVTFANHGGAVAGFVQTVAEGAVIDGCKVSNVTINLTDNTNNCSDGEGGVINNVNTGAIVQNCEFTNIKLSAAGRIKRGGGIFGSVGGKVSGCTVNGVSLITTRNTDIAGGFVAGIGGGAEITDCVLNNVIVDGGKMGSNVGGVFGKVGSAGTTAITLKNITVNGLTLTLGNSKNNCSNVGGFIGQVDYRASEHALTMENCHINGLDMTLKLQTSGESPSAGFISSLNANANITNCSVSGKIDGTGEPLGVGGFLGDIGGYGHSGSQYTVNIKDCKASVAITEAEDAMVGGFVAYAGSYRQTMKLSLSFTNCEATGSFYGQIETGTNETTTFTGCKVDGAAFNG